MNAYEIMLMLDLELAEERQNEILARLRELRRERWRHLGRPRAVGQRRLAYEIDKKDEGIYHLVHFEAEPPRSTRRPACSGSPTASCVTYVRRPAVRHRDEELAVPAA